MAKKLRVGFIGLGLMGSLMAKNILKKEFPLTVYNRTTEKTKELADLGAMVARTPKELADQVDVVITMVTGPKDLEEVLFWKNGVSKGSKLGLDGAPKSLTVVDMETIGPTAAKEIAQKLQEEGIDFLDAPVTGSIPKAANGELTIFIGGDEHILEKVRPVLEALGTNLQYMGPIGSGQAIKLINNQIIAAGILAFSEGMLLADVMGLSREQVLTTLRTTPNVSPGVLLKGENFITDKFDLWFSTANLAKDLRLAKEEMEKTGNVLPELAVTQQVYEKAVEDGLGEKDFSEIIKEIEK